MSGSWMKNEQRVVKTEHENTTEYCTLVKGHMTIPSSFCFANSLCISAFWGMAGIATEHLKSNASKSTCTACCLKSASVLTGTRFYYLQLLGMYLQCPRFSVHPACFSIALFRCSYLQVYDTLWVTVYSSMPIRNLRNTCNWKSAWRAWFQGCIWFHIAIDGSKVWSYITSKSRKLLQGGPGFGSQVKRKQERGNCSGQTFCIPLVLFQIHQPDIFIQHFSTDLFVWICNGWYYKNDKVRQKVKWRERRNMQKHCSQQALHP